MQSPSWPSATDPCGQTNSSGICKAAARAGMSRFFTRIQLNPLNRPSPQSRIYRNRRKENRHFWRSSNHTTK